MSWARRGGGKTTWAGCPILGRSWPFAKESLSKTLDMKSLSICSGRHDSSATFVSKYESEWLIHPQSHLSVEVRSNTAGKEATCQKLQSQKTPHHLIIVPCIVTGSCHKAPAANHSLQNLTNITINKHVTSVHLYYVKGNKSFTPLLKSKCYLVTVRQRDISEIHELQFTQIIIELWNHFSVFQKRCPLIRQQLNTILLRVYLLMPTLHLSVTVYSICEWIPRDSAPRE